MERGGTCPLEPNKSRPLALGAESGACTLHQQQRRRGAQLGYGIQCPSSLCHLHPKMLRASRPLSLLVLLVLATPVRGQAGTSHKALQPWLVGLTAVVVFLFIVFVLLLAHRLWQIRMRRKESGLQDTLGTDRLDHIGHVNLAAKKDSDEENNGEEQSKATYF